jgi:hypothetical protein
MITIAKPLHEDVKAQENHRFLEMLPRIRRQASVAFRQLRPDHKDELIQEVVANAYCAFVRLVVGSISSPPVPATSTPLRILLRSLGAMPASRSHFPFNQRVHSDQSGPSI